jgi:replicative DNA helicase
MDGECETINSEVDKKVNKVIKLGWYDGSDRIVSADEYEKLKKEKAQNPLQLEKLAKLSGMFEGFFPGELFTIAGYTGSGKTLLAKTINYDIMNQGKKTMFISYEVNPISLFPIEQDLKEEFLFLPLELKTMSVPWIIDRIFEARIKHFISAVFIDHLHFIVDMALTNNMSLNIGATMRHLKQAAINLNVTIFVLAHTGQPKDGPPTIADIRDSSFIGQESDGVILVHRISNFEEQQLNFNCFDNSLKKQNNEYDLNFAMATVAKARRSGVFKKNIVMQKSGFYLAEV